MPSTHSHINERTRRRNAQPRPSMDQLASIVEFSDDAVISKDLSGRILTWNSGAEVIYGYSQEEAVGRSIAMLLPQERRHEESDILASIRAGRRVRHFETVRLRKDGSLIDVSLTISPVREGDKVVGASHIARDISERKRLERDTARLAAIVESSEDAIISKDLNGVVETWNRGAERIYGYSATEAIGSNIRMLLPSDRAEEEQEILSQLRNGHPVDHFETRRVRKDGRHINVSLTISPIRDSTGHVVGASHVARDVTERNEFELKMRQTQRLESLGVLAGGIAHDFNNLLTGVLGNASLIAETLSATHHVQEQLAQIMLASTRAADLTRQLLAYAGKGQFLVVTTDLNEVVSEISNLVYASVPKTVDLRIELDKDIPAMKGDRSQIQQLVMNLIINGSEAIPEGRAGIVTVRTGSQHITEADQHTSLATADFPPGEYSYIEVRDDGCGMDEETQARIFEPFFTTKFTGRGLGLAATLGTVRAHGGFIHVQSSQGNGSIFKVFFPAISRETHGDGRPSALTRGTILVVDDEDIVRKLAKLSLLKEGYRVVTASNGKDAVDRFAEMSSSVTLVLLDLMMPVMSGEEVLKRLRKLRSDIPVIISSGYSETEARRRFGVDATTTFLQKPYTAATLRQMVLRILESRGRDESE